MLTIPLFCFSLPSEPSYWETRFPLIKPIYFTLLVEQEKSLVKFPAVAVRYCYFLSLSPPYFLGTSPLLKHTFSYFFKVSQCYSATWMHLGTLQKFCEQYCSGKPQSYLHFITWQCFILLTALSCYWAKCWSSERRIIRKIEEASRWVSWVHQKGGKKCPDLILLVSLCHVVADGKHSSSSPTQLCLTAREVCSYMSASTAKALPCINSLGKS